MNGRAGGAGVLASLESSARALALIKLANVALTMIWGFAVTYVFVRVLPIDEFRAFLLLVAFGNFTVSAEFGLTNIIYSRLRRFWLGSGQGTPSDFRFEEIGVLFLFLLILIGTATLALAAAILGGLIPTAMPLLFLLFFLSACLNLLALLAKRTLAAIDGNIFWEALDFGRRVVVLALLLAILVGIDIRLSVAIQLLLSLAAIVIAMFAISRRLDMRLHQWVALRVGGGHVRRHYLRDIAASASLTVSEILAYNAPYFTIALATTDPRPMLLFDFVFKIARALSMTVRAAIEAALPRLTNAFYSGNAARFRQLLGKALVVALAAAAAAGVGLVVTGSWLVAELFDGKLRIGGTEIALLALLLPALAVICVSVYLQGALGRFSLLLRQSLPFLGGSLLSVPLALLLARESGLPFATLFLGCYALTFVGTAALHGLALRRLLGDTSSAS